MTAYIKTYSVPLLTADVIRLKEKMKETSASRAIGMAVDRCLMEKET